MTERIRGSVVEREVTLAAGSATLEATLRIPEGARGLVLFAHGSGSSRFSPRNRFVAHALEEAGLATLLLDLLTREEEAADDVDAHLRFDIPFLARRLTAATDWVQRERETAHLPVGYFGASTGAAAALVAAADRPGQVSAVVSRGGRPDLAEDALPEVHAPTLLIVGGSDFGVIELNQDALARLRCRKHLSIVPGATHLFEEPGTLAQVAQLAAQWFTRYLVARDALAHP